MHILLTNDDGIYSDGLKALADAALRRGHRVTVSAPSSQCSTFCRTDLRVTLCGKVKVWEDRSRSESESEEGEKLHDVDPKPGDLSMARLK